VNTLIRSQEEVLFHITRSSGSLRTI